MLYVLILILPFAVIVFFGAPYVPTLRKQQKKAAELFELKPGDLVIDLGAGDGGVVIALAKQGYVAVGYELNPIVWAVGYIRCLRYKNATMRLGNYWTRSLPPETKGIYIFLASKFMKKLDVKIKQDLPEQHTQLVSFGFELPHRPPLKTVDGLHFYIY